MLAPEDCMFMKQLWCSSHSSYRPGALREALQLQRRIPEKRTHHSTQEPTNCNTDWPLDVFRGKQRVGRYEKSRPQCSNIVTEKKTAIHQTR